MKFIYNIAIYIYKSAIRIAARRNPKAKLRFEGSVNTLKEIKKLNPDKKKIWFHCASLGEFEQGRPVIEKIKTQNPDTEIILSFFSPSGYEIRKNYKFADAVFYLPDDTKKNARQWIHYINPSEAFFVKYEFWYWYLKTLKENNIPVYLISGIFRKNQIFFKPWGLFFRKILKNFTHFFVQNRESEKLLQKLKFTNISIAGDTRFDRVIQISESAKKYPTVDRFVADNFILVAGSTWQPDEEIILNFFQKSPDRIKYVIVPHEIREENIEKFIQNSALPAIRYSKAENVELEKFRVLVIDNIGMLSSLYAYADTAYVGGGFGAGIHNTLEAAVFGVPIIFGPNYRKFDEAVELIRRFAAVSINSFSEFEQILLRLIIDEEARKFSGNAAIALVNENSGATEKILGFISNSKK
jgi:3-deoxy-D-manno-octulosonic-acid transferase